jgi:hypothetical protein
LFAGRPVPVIVNFVPATAMSGDVFRVPIVADGFDAGAIGPGSCATPGMTGATSGVGAAEAKAGRSRNAPASDATDAAVFMWRFMAAIPFFSVTE